MVAISCLEDLEREIDMRLQEEIELKRGDWTFTPKETEYLFSFELDEDFDEIDEVADLIGNIEIAKGGALCYFEWTVDGVDLDTVEWELELRVRIK